MGKSSLVRKFVHSVFSDDYHSTLGVKVDRKTVTIDGWDVAMVLWDMHGETEGLEVPKNYLRGASAALVVFDATRPETATIAAELCERVKEVSPNAIVMTVANKSDIATDWDAADQAAANIDALGPIRTSAKTGDNVDEAFSQLAVKLIERAS